jgi:hypothetical protein
MILATSASPTPSASWITSSWAVQPSSPRRPREARIRHPTTLVAAASEYGAPRTTSTSPSPYLCVRRAAAPRPQLLISVGGDETWDFPQVGFPFIWHVYEIHGQADLVESVHLADERHDYCPSKRKAVYAFFAKHLGLSPLEEDLFSAVPDAPPGPPEELQLPGDSNQDAALDISDAVCVFGVLFLGTPPRFPCGCGSPDDPASVALIDWQPDGQIVISDGISLLQFLFSGGPPHALAARGDTRGCVALPGCPQSHGCR